MVIFRKQNMFAFGDNIAGQLGVGDRTNRHTLCPVKLPSTVEGHVRKVCCGPNTTYVLTTTGQIFVAGNGTEVLQPVPWAKGLRFTDLCVSALELLLVTADGGLWRMATTGPSQQPTPARLPLPDGECAAMCAAGALFTLVLTTSGECWSMGYNARGALGVGSSDEKLATTDLIKLQFPSSGDETGCHISSIACGGAHAVAVDHLSGRVFVWGDGSSGQLGLEVDGDRSFVAAPTCNSHAANCCWVECGDKHTLFGLQSGELLVCGSNKHCELGIDSNGRDVHVPTTQPIPRGDVISVSINGGYGSSHCIIRTSAGLFASGSNSHGQCGVPAPANLNEVGSGGVAKQEPSLQLLASIPLASDAMRSANRVSCGWRHSVLWQRASSITELGDLAVQRRSDCNVPFRQLVPDVCEVIIDFLCLPHLLALSRVNKEWDGHVRFHSLWDKKYLERMKKWGGTPEVPPSDDYKAAFASFQRDRYDLYDCNFTSNRSRRQVSLGRMASVWQSVQFWFKTREVRIIFAGQNAAGKTTLLYQLRSPEMSPVTTIPTIGFNVETVKYHNFNFMCWDIGGEDKVRMPLLHFFYDGVEAFLYIVDSTWTEEYLVRQSRDEIMSIASNLPHAKVLIVANKMDLPSAMPLRVLLRRLDLERVLSGRVWALQGASALTGQGLASAIEWLATALA